MKRKYKLSATTTRRVSGPANICMSIAADQKRLALEISGNLARITLAHPPLNVIDFQMMDDLLDGLHALEQRKEVAVVILTGGGRAFSAGVDVAIHTPE